MNPQATRHPATWETLPQVPCCAVIVVSNAAASAAAPRSVMRQARVRSEDIDGDAGSTHLLLEAGSPRQIRKALAGLTETGTAFDLTEVGLCPSRSSCLADLTALAAWPETLVTALGKRYLAERTSRSGKPPASERYVPWSVDDLYDYVYNGAMLLPGTWVKRLKTLD